MQVSLDPHLGYLLIWDGPFIIITILLCLISRACNIFPLSYLLNKYRVTPVLFNMQFAMWFAGLRGAIAFALALQVTTEHSTQIVTTTLATVLFTTFVLGGSTEPLLRLLNLKNAPEPKAEVLSDGLLSDAPRGFARFWLIFDNTYMKRWFGGDIDADFSLAPVDITPEHHDGHDHHPVSKVFCCYRILVILSGQ